jgi:hypothetical protein
MILSPISVRKAVESIVASWSFMESRQHREISRIPVAEIRDIPWSHYDDVKLCFSSSLKVSLFFRIFRMLYAWDM